MPRRARQSAETEGYDIMATATETVGENEQASKTVTVVGYPSGDWEVLREWADEFDDEHDYYEMDTRSKTRRYLKYPGGRMGLSRSDYDEMVGFDFGEAKLVEETKEVQEHEVSESEFGTQIRREIIRRLPEEVAGFELGGYNKFRWRDEDGDYRVKIYRYTDEMPMLKHQSEMTPDDMYEDEDEVYPVVKYKIEISGVSPDELDEINEEIVEPFVTMLAKHRAIGRTRIAECEQKTEQKGVCLNI